MRKWKPVEFNSSQITELVHAEVEFEFIHSVSVHPGDLLYHANPWYWVEVDMFYFFPLWFINQELKLPCAWVVESSGILNVLIKLLEVVQPCLQAAKEQKEVQTPKWVTLYFSWFYFYFPGTWALKLRAWIGYFTGACMGQILGTFLWFENCEVPDEVKFSHVVCRFLACPK